jgi:hypothetical protein
LNVSSGPVNQQTIQEGLHAGQTTVDPLMQIRLVTQLLWLNALRPDFRLATAGLRSTIGPDLDTVSTPVAKHLSKQLLS